MGRKWSVTVTLSDGVLGTVDTLAVKERRSRSFTVEELLVEALTARGVTVEAKPETNQTEGSAP